MGRELLRSTDGLEAFVSGKSGAIRGREIPNRSGLTRETRIRDEGALRGELRDGIEFRVRDQRGGQVMWLALYQHACDHKRWKSASQQKMEVHPGHQAHQNEEYVSNTQQAGFSTTKTKFNQRTNLPSDLIHDCTIVVSLTILLMYIVDIFTSIISLIDNYIIY